MKSMKKTFAKNLAVTSLISACLASSGHTADFAHLFGHDKNDPSPQLCRDLKQQYELDYKSIQDEMNDVFASKSDAATIQRRVEDNLAIVMNEGDASVGEKLATFLVEYRKKALGIDRGNKKLLERIQRTL